MKKKLKVALIGNPNCGKTTIFNFFTGFRQKIGNYPGVTVEKKLGYKKINDIDLEIIDLPGIYSFSAHSEDERVAKNFILNEKPDVIINIIDASNIEKSLVLTTELLEHDRPVILALNMMDVAEKRKIDIDVQYLEKILEVNAISVVASKNKNLDELLKKAVSIAKKEKTNGVNVKFSKDIESEIQKIENILPDEISSKKGRLISLKLLEEDEDFQKKINNKEIIEKAKVSKKKLEEKFKDHLEVIISNDRDLFLKEILKKVVKRKKIAPETPSDKIDKILIHKYFALPLFLLIMYSIFQFTFFIGSYPTNWIGTGIKYLTTSLSNIWPETTYSLMRSLVIDGIIAGVGSVIAFLPNIMILFFWISILEESGYMARAAFILDKLMHKIGLHGKSCIPMLIGFGCSVPAIMSTRFMESKKDRLITILVLPLVACSAKMVVFTLIIPAFFPKALQPVVLFSLYIFGIALAIVVIKIFKITFFKQKSFSFVMELPEYRLPSLFSTFLLMWDKSKEYIKKAGTLILGFSILLWFLAAFPKNETSNDLSNSYMGKIGHVVEPIFKPLGFDWKINTSIISSFAAKEVFVAQLGVIYAIKDPGDVKGLQKALKQDYSMLQAICIMIFILISTPCIATIAITKKEMKSYKWALFQFLYLSFLAYFITLIVFQVGSFILGKL